MKITELIAENLLSSKIFSTKVFQAKIFRSVFPVHQVFKSKFIIFEILLLSAFDGKFFENSDLKDIRDR